MREQEQFLEVIDRDEAERRFTSAIRCEPLEEIVALTGALGRVLSRDVASAVNVPSFDRSNVDGFAVQAADTFGSGEETPRRLALLPASISTGQVPLVEITPGTCALIATGGMLPRGSDAVVMVEHAESTPDEGVLIRRPVTPGAHISFAGTDIAEGETVLHRGQQLTSRETGVLAAIGVAAVSVFRRPRVGIVSTGDEIIAPGKAMQPGLVYDSNARIIADAVREIGGDAIEKGIVSDDADELRSAIQQGLLDCDILLLSGGTSKGAGDLSYRIVRELRNPGIVAHGVALKPGKPICLAAHEGKPVVILPGFPTSAIFTFHEFVAPVIRRMAGLEPLSRNTVQAKLAIKLNSEIGRTEYVLVGLIRQDADAGTPVNSSSAKHVAFPLGKGSGSVTTFSHADGFISIDRHTEIVAAESMVDVQLLSRDVRIADLVVIGSHCVGLDYLLSCLRSRGWQHKFIAVGSTAGLDAARRGQCDIAGIHLMDPATGEYNRPFVGPELQLVRGYGRLQGVVFREGDQRFAGHSAAEAIAAVVSHDQCMMVNRNQGSGTRILIDRLLNGAKPRGYAMQSRNHHAVVAAIAQRRADWGVAIETVARQAGLGFLPLVEEQFDFVVPRGRLGRQPVEAFLSLLNNLEIRRELENRGFRVE